jgi:hypothetical protein
MILEVLPIWDWFGTKSCKHKYYYYCTYYDLFDKKQIKYDLRTKQIEIV